MYNLLLLGGCRKIELFTKNHELFYFVISTFTMVGVKNARNHFGQQDALYLAR